MIDPSKIYTIVCSKDSLGVFVPHDADGSPTRLEGRPCNDVPPTPIRCEHLGGDKYKLIPVCFPDQVIAVTHDGLPKTLVLTPHSDGDNHCTNWSIERNDSDHYEIHTCAGPENEYWTVTGDGVPIELCGPEGSDNQQWLLRLVDA